MNTRGTMVQYRMGIQHIQNTKDLAEPIEEIHMPCKSSLKLLHS